MTFSVCHFLGMAPSDPLRMLALWSGPRAVGVEEEGAVAETAGFWDLCQAQYNCHQQERARKPCPSMFYTYTDPFIPMQKKA